MRKPLLLMGIVTGLMVWSWCAAAAGYFERWNDPLLENNYWRYWIDPDGAPAEWSSTGGVGNSGHIASPLGVLETWGLANTYWPIYTMDGQRRPEQEIDLVQDPILTAVLSAGGLSVSLGGGRVYYFIGEWNANGPGPDDAIFYRTKAALTINPLDWNVPSPVYAGSDLEWELIFSVNSSKKASELFTNPQQYGLVVIGAAGAMSGNLFVDNFGVIPEPAGAAWAALGLGLWAIWPSRRRPL